LIAYRTNLEQFYFIKGFFYRSIDYIISEIPEALKDSLNGVNIIRNIIDSMRTFSHNSENKEIIENINKHIISTIKISKNYWKNILSIELNLSENLPKIKANIGKLNQVFLNLIINAVDAIKDDRNKHKKENKIIVSSYLKEDKLVISFKDTGVGIDEENRDKIFTLFFTTKEVGKGTGQGLSISYSIIVNEHLGKMYFESQKFKGSTFFIELPLLEE
jgi:signal transduction histidine kinase